MEWVTCATCGLHHSSRPDGRCPRCREPASQATPPADGEPRRAAQPEQAPPGRCQSCGRVGPTRHVTFRQNVGLLVLRLRKKVEGDLCRTCVDRHFGQLTLVTLVGGWWGIVSFFVTPFLLVMNVVEYAAACASPELGGDSARGPRVLGAPRGVVALAAAGLAVLVLLVGALAWFTAPLRQPRAAQTPEGSGEFDSANQSILAFRGRAAFGNTPEAEVLALELSGKLELIRKVAFTGGREAEAASLTRGHFLTHCEVRDGSVCFLVHVPGLRHYRPDARDALARAAWEAARQVTERLAPERRARLGLGLRGVVLYGAVLVGPPAAETPAVGTDSSALIAFFRGPVPRTASPSPSVAETAKAALPSPTPPLSAAERLDRDIEAIGLDQFEPRHAAAQDLESLGLAAVPRLIRTAQDPKRPVEARATAMHLLGRSGSAAAVPVLLQCLEDARAGGSAGEGIHEFKGAEELILPQLARDIERRCVSPRKSDTRWLAYCFHALPTLGKFGPAASFAAPTVLRVIQNHSLGEDGHTRTVAITVAGQIGPAARDAVPYMIADLSSSDTYPVQQSIASLSAMGPSAAAAVPALERLRGDPSWARQAEEALARIRSGGPSAR